MEALVYVRVDPGKSLEIAKAIKGIKGVKEVYAVTGRFDIVAKTEAADVKALGETVVGRIQKVAGVRSTETSLIVA